LRSSAADSPPPFLLRLLAWILASLLRQQVVGAATRRLTGALRV
jgi:hypothetical protein